MSTEEEIVYVSGRKKHPCEELEDVEKEHLTEYLNKLAEANFDSNGNPDLSNVRDDVTATVEKIWMVRKRGPVLDPVSKKTIHGGREFRRLPFGE